MQISTEGFISFGLSPGALLDSSTPSSDPIIAPLVDLDRVIEVDTQSAFYFRTTTSPTLLAEVVNTIAESNPGLAGFQPRLAVVVTWFMSNPQLVSTCIQ